MTSKRPAILAIFAGAIIFFTAVLFSCSDDADPLPRAGDTPPGDSDTSLPTDTDSPLVVETTSGDINLW